MHYVFLLVFALAGSDWHCTESDGLWDCRPARPQSRVTARPLESQAVAAAASPVASAAGSTLPTESPVVEPTESGAAPGPNSAGEAPAGTAPTGTALTSTRSAPPIVSPAASELAYVVQIGAFRRRAEAEAAVSELDREGVVIVANRRDGITWYLVLLGAFSTLEDARAAGAEYEADSGGSFWVRNAADLREVKAADEAS